MEESHASASAVVGASWGHVHGLSGLTGYQGGRVRNLTAASKAGPEKQNLNVLACTCLLMLFLALRGPRGAFEAVM